MSVKPPFSWYGGKESKLMFILPKLPQTRIFVDAFGGSGAVLLGREKSDIEVYNDLDGDLTTFFLTLRERGEELVEMLSLTLYSRREFELALEKSNDDLERSRRFFVRTMQSWMSLGQTATKGRWSISFKARSGGGSNRLISWLKRVDGLLDVADRIREVIIENMDIIELLRKYDSEEALIYCDPPYVLDTRSDKSCYKHEMSNLKHRTFAKEARKCEAKIAISGYHNYIYENVLNDWNVYEMGEMGHPVSKETRNEVLWTNFDAENIIPSGMADVTEFFGD